MALTITSTTSTQEELEALAKSETTEEEAPVVEAQPTTEEKPPAKPEAKNGDEPGSRGYLRRIDKLTRDNETLRTLVQSQNDRFDRLLTTLEAKGAPPPQKDDGPKLSDYKTPEEWHDARDAWKRGQEASAEEQSVTQQTAQEIFDGYQRRALAFSEEHEDFDAKVKAADITIWPAMEQAIREMENGPAVALWLADHPEETRKSYEEMTPLGAVRYVERVSAQLEVGKNPTPEPKTVATTAPAPAPSIGRGNGHAEIPIDKLSMKDYKRAMRAREQQ